MVEGSREALVSLPLPPPGVELASPVSSPPRKRVKTGGVRAGETGVGRDDEGATFGAGPSDGRRSGIRKSSSAAVKSKGKGVAPPPPDALDTPQGKGKGPERPVRMRDRPPTQAVCNL